MWKRQQGFTLLEILIVLAILALVASLAFPLVQRNQDKARYEVSVINLREVAKGMEKHYIEKGRYPVFKSWGEVSSENSPLMNYVNDIPATDKWNRAYKIEESTETGYRLSGLAAPGKSAKEYPDYSFSTNVRFKQKGVTVNQP